MITINERNIFIVMIAGSCSLLAALAVFGYIINSAEFAISIVAGGILAIANFFWLRSVLLRSIRLQPKEAPRFALLRFLVRLALLGLVVFVLIVYCRINIVGLLLGLSVLVLTISIMSIFMISAKGD